MRFGITEGIIFLALFLIILFIMSEYFPKPDFYATKCLLVLFPQSVIFRMTLAQKAFNWEEHTNIPWEKERARREAIALLKQARAIVKEMPGAEKYRTLFMDDIDMIEERARKRGLL